MENQNEGQRKEGKEDPKGPLVEAPYRAPVNPGKQAFGRVTVGGFFTPKLFTFQPNELRFLREFGPDVSVEEAAKKAGVPVEYCVRCLRKKAVREFLADKFQQIALQQGWTAERWFAEGDKVWRGTKVISPEQLTIWKEFGARILPKTRTVVADNAQEKPQITINIGAIDEAFQRQQRIKEDIIEAENGV